MPEFCIKGTEHWIIDLPSGDATGAGGLLAMGSKNNEKKDRSSGDLPRCHECQAMRQNALRKKVQFGTVELSSQPGSFFHVSFWLAALS